MKLKIHFSQIILLALALFTMILASQVTTHASVKTNRLESTAMRQLGKPYVYGATGTRSFDCSGFTQYIFKKHGVHLQRTAQAQYDSTKHIRAKHVRKGDLVFFGGSRRNIYHVGLYIGNGKMIDAQNRGVVTENVHAPWWHVVGYSRPASWA